MAAMSEYQKGSLEAFEALYAALAPELARHFGGVVRGADAARDLVQDTFMEIHRSRHTWLAPLPVRPWAFGVARNVLRRHRRSAWRRGRYLEFPGELREPRPSGGAKHLDGGDVREALGQVAPARRQAFELHHLHGFSFAEIARRLGISIDGAKLRSSRAMNAVRELLGVERGGRRG